MTRCLKWIHWKGCHPWILLFYWILMGDILSDSIGGKSCNYHSEFFGLVRIE
jgi:hypothetical protein